MRQLEVRDLQLGVATADHRVVFAPVELEGLAGCKAKWYERVAARGLLRFLLFGPPGAGERRDPVIGTGIAQLHQVTV